MTINQRIIGVENVGMDVYSALAAGDTLAEGDVGRHIMHGGVVRYIPVYIGWGRKITLEDEGFLFRPVNLNQNTENEKINIP